MAMISEELRHHLNDQQHVAVQILGIFKGLQVLDMSRAAPEAITVLIELGTKLADGLCMDLDGVTLVGKLAPPAVHDAGPL